MRRSAKSSLPTQCSTTAAIQPRQRSRSGSGRSSMAADRASRARWGASSRAAPSRTSSVSNTPSPRTAARSSAVSKGSFGSSTVPSKVTSTCTAMVRPYWPRPAGTSRSRTDAYDECCDRATCGTSGNPARTGHAVDAAAPDGARRGPPTRPRHTRDNLCLRAAVRARGEHQHGLPHAGPARGDRAGPPHPPRPRRADLLQRGPRTRAPGVPPVPARDRDRPRRAGSARRRSRYHPRVRAGPRASCPLGPVCRMHSLRIPSEGIRVTSPLQTQGAAPAPENSPDAGVAWHYGDPFAEQRAASTAAVVVDRSNRGLIAVPGADRLSWLHSLTSQHLTELADGEGTEALLLDINGRVEHHMVLANLDGTTWIDTEAAGTEALLAYLQKMVFWADAQPRDAHDELAMLSVQGPMTDQLLELPGDVYGVSALPGGGYVRRMPRSEERRVGKE